MYLRFVKKVDLMLSILTKAKNKETRKLLEVMDIFISLILVIVSQVYIICPNLPNYVH